MVQRNSQGLKTTGRIVRDSTCPRAVRGHIYKVIIMTKIYFKDSSHEFISSDLFKAVNEFSEILREKLGDDSERIFREILSDTFDYTVSECSKCIGEDLFYVVENPFFE